MTITLTCNGRVLTVPEDMSVDLHTAESGRAYMSYERHALIVDEEGDLIVVIEGDLVVLEDLAEAKEVIDEYRANMLACFVCKDCTDNTSIMDEYYMVTDEIWAQAGMAPDGGMLCIGCLEARIGRQLTAADFPAYPVNHPAIFSQSERLAQRITCTEVKIAA
jgi:hypothetical protein